MTDDRQLRIMDRLLARCEEQRRAASAAAEGWLEAYEATRDERDALRAAAEEARQARSFDEEAWKDAQRRIGELEAALREALANPAMWADILSAALQPTTDHEEAP